MDVLFRNGRMKKAKGLCSFLLLVMVSFCDASRLGMTSQRLVVSKYLSRLNKTPLKSIESPEGDIIDCVHVYNQPAFDHPLLKNHTIQMRPSYYPEGLAFDDSQVSIGKSRGKSDKTPITQLWHLNGSCPEGTVPIRRTKEEDVLRARSVESFGKKKPNSIPMPKSADLDDEIVKTGHEHAIAYAGGGRYYGAKATMNIWAPQIQQPNEFSLSQLWVLGGSFNTDLNSVEAGWQVSPQLYGDKNPRLFIYWTNDSYHSTGCYNLLCSGFIQTSRKISLGSSIAPISSYGGAQYQMTIHIWKDSKDGNWWMKFGHQIIGYWPASLFTHLADSASTIEWGGEVINSESDGMHTTTQMGSGHFPGENFGKASYFRNIYIDDASNNLRYPDDLETYAYPSSNCYDISLGQTTDTWGKNFYYGGPGRNPNCP